MDLWDSCKKYFLEIEALLAVVLVIGLFIVFFMFISQSQWSSLLINMESKVYPVTSIGAITLLGFIITGISILITFTETPALKPLKTSQQYTTLFKIYFSAIKHLGALALLSIIGMLIGQDHMIISQIIFYLVVLFVLTSIIRTYRCLWVLQKFIEIIHGNSSQPS